MERQLVQDQLAQIHRKIAVFREELGLLTAEARWRSASGGSATAALTPAITACARRLTNLRRELYEVRLTASR